MRAGILIVLMGCHGARPVGSSTDDARVLEGPFTGIRVAAGDLTGDGRADAIVSAPGIDGAGAVHVLEASARGLLGAEDAVGSFLAGGVHDVGEGLAGCGDTDGDGAMDLMIGAPYADDGAGGAWLISGPLVGSRGPDDARFLRVTASDARAGWAVTCAGDLDADGLADLALTAPDAPGFGIATDAGEVSFFRGTPTGPSNLGSLSTTFSDSALGAERSLVFGDLDGDGLDEAVVGAPGVSRIHLVFGPVRGAYDPNEAGLTWSSSDDALGTAIAIGDLDGDGHADVVAGAPGYDADRGRIAVVHGPVLNTEASGALDARGRWIEGQDDGERTGFAVDLGPLDDDGRADIVAGAPGAVTVGSEAGVAYVLRGPAGVATVADADAVILGGVPLGNLGWSVAVVPGQGVLVGAPYADVDGRIGAGAAYLFGADLRGAVGVDDALSTVVVDAATR